MVKEPKKTFTVLDLDFAQREFYNNYNADYWDYKIFLLKNAHDFYDKLGKDLSDGLGGVDNKDFKRVIRTEMHFTYFQMIESLFEIIFALSEHDNRSLWIALTFSNDWKTEFYSDCYNKIKEFSEGKLKEPKFGSTIKITIENEEVEISLLRWIFYFVYKTSLSKEDWEKNLKNIHSLLKLFAKDFSDRGEYNAYKHSLRFYNSPFQLGISETGSDVMQGIGKSEDSIIYLKEKKNDQNNAINIRCVTKPFDFERDFRCCLIISSLIKNAINTRKYSLLKDLKGKKFHFSTFADIKYPEDFIPKTGVTKFSVNI